MNKNATSRILAAGLIFAIFVGCGAGTQKGSSEKGPITTNYHDLDENHHDQLQEVISSNELNQPTERGLVIMQTYLNDKVIKGNNPINNNLRTNYFWHIYNALPSFVDANERHQGYYKGETDVSVRNRLLAYAIYRIDRSPENVKAAFDYFKPRISRLITPSIYVSQGLEQEVNSLINSYQVITSVNNYENLLRQAHNHVDTASATIFIDKENGEILYEPILPAYGLDVYSMNRIITYYLGMNPDIPFYSEGALSFWMRRNREGNMDMVYRILKEIDEMY